MKGPSVSRLVGVRPVLSALAVLALILLVLGLPVNDFFRFLLLTVAVMAVCFGRVRSEPRRWLIALAIAFAVATAHWMLPGPQIEEVTTFTSPWVAAWRCLNGSFRPARSAL
jgi:cell division protein FtsW (lipid II flippase)